MSLDIQLINGFLVLLFSLSSIENRKQFGTIMRQHCNLHVVLHNTSIQASSIQIFGVKIYSSLDTVSKSAPTLNIFRSKFKSFIVTYPATPHNFVH